MTRIMLLNLYLLRLQRKISVKTNENHDQKEISKIIKKMKKVILSLAAVTIIGMPIGNVMAASMTFTNYKFTTVPNSESYIAVSSKAKADNDQYWYVTLTSSKGLGTTGNPRAIFTSAVNARKASESSSKLGLYKNMTGVQKKKYPSKMTKGTKCKLYVIGNNNNSKKYTITLSGRYTS